MVHRGQRDAALMARTGDDIRGALGFEGGVEPAGRSAADDTPTLYDCGVAFGTEVTPPPCVASLPVPLPPPTFAAEAVMGFPQSMQKREAASFSRPQKEQRVKRQTPTAMVMGREYRSGLWEGQPNIRLNE